MANEPQEPPIESAKPGKQSRFQSIIIVGMLMLFEGVGIFLATKMLSHSPDSAAADAKQSASADDKKTSNDDLQDVELVIAECKPTNSRGGKLYYYKIHVSVLVDRSKQEFIKKLIEQKRSRIDERVNVVIRGIEPKYLNEPGFQTIKRQLKAEFDRIFGDDQLIKEVFIAELIRMNGGI